MKNKSKEKPKEQKQPLLKAAEPVDFSQLVDTLLQQKDELFEDRFLTEDDKDLIDTLPKEYQERVRSALLNKGVLFRILQGKLQRVSADYANFQKRTPKQIADTICYEKEKFIKTLLPALDNFESALGGLRNAHSAENADVLIKGVRIIYDQMLDILKSHGVEQIKALGEKFDPALHEAMTQKVEPEREENIVLEEFQKGYKLNGRVIRPTKVIVSTLQSEQTAQQQMPTEEKPQQQAESPEEITDEYEKTDME
jgi:molecular chaperone GrpE